MTKEGPVPRLNCAASLEKLSKEILSKRDPKKPYIAVCAGTGCIPLGARRVIASLKEEVQKQGVAERLEIKETGCPGFCEKGPIFNSYPQGVSYYNVQPEDVAEVVSLTIAGRVVERLLYVDPVTKERAVCEGDIPFYKYQMRLLLGNNAKLDPRNIEDSIALGGYSTLAKALFQMTPDQVVDEVEKSELRGRGGAGFPTGRKWRIAKNSPGDIKYVIINCDEGDPGAFMNRAILEGNPHSVLEGLAIGAYAINASEGIVYVREEYPLAVENVGIAVRQAEEYGLLGKDILGSGFDFRVKVARGGGAFVCGEETALIASLEGKPGEPKQRPPYPAISGLWGRPTNINNVETWANIPLIVNKGADWFTSIGTTESKGTKIFSLVGKVNNTGLVEVPMGISLRDVVYKIGGGLPNGKKFKAVQTGGPSGGCIPEKFLDTPVDYEELAKLGSIMGSGGMIVMDEDTCMVDLAKYFLNFLADESCGKCLSCREGIRQMHQVLTEITEGRGRSEHIDLLRRLAETVKATSLCALGQTAPNPVLTTLRYFIDEYVAHIEEKRCPAYVCKSLISYYIDPARCQACMICLKSCPANAIDGGKNLIHLINQQKCVKCGACYRACPHRFAAVLRLSGVTEPISLTAEERVLVRGKSG